MFVSLVSTCPAGGLLVVEDIQPIGDSKTKFLTQFLPQLISDLQMCCARNRTLFSLIAQSSSINLF